MNRWRAAGVLSLLAVSAGLMAADELFMVPGKDGILRPYQPPQSLAKCLAKKGFKFYGASWCPYCAQQIRLFGSDAQNLPYVECSADGTRDGPQTRFCAKAGVRGYPEWHFRNGHLHGVRTPEELARLSGCDRSQGH